MPSKKTTFEEDKKLVAKRRTAKIDSDDQVDPGTLQWKKSQAILLKAADNSYAYISKHLGVTKRLVKYWFESDPTMHERVEVVRKDMTDGALKMLKSASVEAVDIILQSARGALRDRQWKEAREGAETVLDRTGLSKVNKSESKVTKTDRTEHDVSEDFFDKFESLPIETQRRVAEMMAEVQELVTAAKGSE